MKLHAGSLYSEYLILYGENEIPKCLKVEDESLQWDIYCKDVEFTPSDRIEGFADIIFEGKKYSFPYWETNNPMRFLGFA